MRTLLAILLRHRGVDRGVSLVELLVASAILAIVVPIGGGILHSAVVSQRDVDAVTKANTASQAVAASVEAGVRNAAALRLTAAGADGADELLVARIRTGVAADSDSWVCQGWFYSSVDDVLYTRRIPATSATTPIVAPTSTTVAAWTPLAAAVTPPGSGRLFALSGDLRRVDLAVVVSAGERRPAALSTSVVRRPQAQIKGTPCF